MNFQPCPSDAMLARLTVAGNVLYRVETVNASIIWNMSDEKG